MKFLNRNLKKGAQYMNEKLKEKYEKIYENYRKDFSLEDKKNIIMACILYSEIQEKLPNEQKLLLQAPKILVHQYFEQNIESFDGLIDIV